MRPQENPQLQVRLMLHPYEIVAHFFVHARIFVYYYAAYTDLNEL
jgi:hypothetical protein